MGYSLGTQPNSAGLRATVSDVTSLPLSGANEDGFIKRTEITSERPHSLWSKAV